SINFDKAKAQRWIESLSNGTAIDAARNVDDVLALAGACFFVAMSQAPQLHKAVDWERLGRKPEQESQDEFFPELHAAIEYYGQLMMLVAAGEYDQEFDRRHKAIVLVENGKKTVIPVEGVRDDENE